jgi:1,4-dihydroxy-2-naphthoate polyprenyltransferase
MQSHQTDMIRLATEFIRYGIVLARMSRPAQLLAITLVYSLGCLLALANGVEFNSSYSAAGFLALIPISISIHFANEYADFETDRLTVRTPFSGGSGALPESGYPRQIALIGAWITLILGSVLAITGWGLGRIPSISLFILFLGGFFGWMYSLRPLALAWNGWGELTNALLGGVLLPLYAFSAHTRWVDWKAILTFIPFGMLVFINLLATTWPDRQADAMVGKRTLATRWPVARLRLLYLMVAMGAVLILLLLRNVIYPHGVVWSSLSVVPILVWSTLAYTRQHSPFPTVAAMVFFLLVHLATWWLVI